MHFFYLDETGCSGADLQQGQEPIFVLGGLSVRDEGWIKTTSEFNKLLCKYFNVQQLAPDFELHAHQLLSPDGLGYFLGDPRADRNKLTFDLLDLLEKRSHHIHYLALEKVTLDATATGAESEIYNTREPYLLAYDYLVTYIETCVRSRLGQSARGMIILDINDQYARGIEKITQFRRLGVSKTHRLTRVVEFSYPINSEKHPMIQFSDLIIFCIRKFFEMDKGYRNDYSAAARLFYATCFEKIYGRVNIKNVMSQKGNYAQEVNNLLNKTWLKPSTGWKDKYKPGNK